MKGFHFYRILRPLRMKRLRSYLTMLLIGSGGLSYGYLQSRGTREVLPFEYDPSSLGGILIPAKVQGRAVRLSLSDFGQGSSLSGRLRKEMEAKGAERYGLTELTAETHAGTYQRAWKYGIMDEDPPFPKSSSAPWEGSLSLSYFAPSAINKNWLEPPVRRLIFDFRARTLTVERRRSLPEERPSPNRWVFPLQVTEYGSYCIPLQVESNTSLLFQIGLSNRATYFPRDVCPDTLRQRLTPNCPTKLKLSSGSFQRVVPMIPISGTSDLGYLGLDFLSEYRLTLDFQNKRLSLEPPKE